MADRWICDAHRHLGALPEHPFYGGPAIAPAVGARTSVRQLLADMDAERVERAVVMPNYGVPDPDVAFALNELVVEAAGADDRIRAALWVSPKPSDAARTAKALSLAGEHGVAALKVSFLLGGRPADESCRPQLDQIFATAREHRLVVHVHTSPGAASDIDEVAHLVETYGDEVDIHLVHFGGGMSGHLKLAGSRFFDWIGARKRVYTDLSWSIGFAPRFLLDQIERRGAGADRILFASDEPWSDFAGEFHKLAAVTGDGELFTQMFSDTFHRVYG